MKAVQSKYDFGMTLSACLWLGLFPLLQGGTYARITLDKWRIMLVLCGVTLACFLLDRALLPALRRKSSLPEPPAERAPLLPLLTAAGLLLWTVLSCLLSASGPEVWWLAPTARYEGLASRLCYAGLFFCFLFSRVRVKTVLYAAAAGLAVFFAVVLLQRAGSNPLGLYPAGRSYARNPEFQGTIGNIDMGTGYLLLLSGLFLFSLAGEVPALRAIRSRPAGALPAAVFLFGLAVSVFLILTMDVQFGAVSLGVLLLTFFLRLLPRKRRLPLLALLLVLALAVVWFWPGQVGGVWELHEILHGRARLSFGSNRLAVWLYSLQLSGEALLLGGGCGTFPARFNQYLADHDYVIPQKQNGIRLPDYFDNPHNEYLAWLTDQGLPALLLFLILLGAAVFRRRDSWLPVPGPCAAAVLCYGVQAFFSFSVCLVAPLFWVLLALSFRE